MIDKPSVADTIVERARRLRLPLYRLAESVSVSRHTLYSMSCGRTTHPSWDVVQALSDELDRREAEAELVKK